MPRSLIVIAMPEPLVARFFSPALRERLREFGDVACSPTPSDHSTPEARALLADADVIISGWGTAEITADVLDATPRLRGVVHSAGTVRGVVSPDCYERGVVISSQAWANALPVAEYTLAMILLAAKGGFGAQFQYRAKRAAFHVYAERAAKGAYQRRVGVIGASTIGRRVIELLGPFDLEVVLADPTLGPAEGAELGVELLSMEELLASSAIVSLHAPLLPSTAGMIGADELALLGEGATFINTARGALVDHTALVRELQAGRIEAVLDVTDPEPPPPDSPLWDLPNVVLTPHIAGAAGTELHRLGSSAVEEAGRVISGQPLLHPVTRGRYDAIA